MKIYITSTSDLWICAVNAILSKIKLN